MPITTKFATAFAKLQGEIKPALKDATNPHFRSKYADLSAVWEAVRAPMAKHGFGIIQSPQYEGDNIYLETTLLHDSGEFLTSKYPLKPSKPDPQGYGSALTYARRYSIAAMLGVVADEDDDGNAASAKPLSQPLPAQDDQDVIDGVKNWIAKHKITIMGAKRMPELYGWLDAQGQTEAFDRPKSGSNLDRLKRKSPEAFEEIKQAYMNQLSEIASTEK